MSFLSLPLSFFLLIVFLWIICLTSPCLFSRILFIFDICSTSHHGFGSASVDESASVGDGLHHLHVRC